MSQSLSRSNGGVALGECLVRKAQTRARYRSRVSRSEISTLAGGNVYGLTWKIENGSNGQWGHERSKSLGGTSNRFGSTPALAGGYQTSDTRRDREK